MLARLVGWLLPTPISRSALADSEWDARVRDLSLFFERGNAVCAAARARRGVSFFSEEDGDGCKG